MFFSHILVITGQRERQKQVTKVNGVTNLSDRSLSAALSSSWAGAGDSASSWPVKSNEGESQPNEPKIHAGQRQTSRTVIQSVMCCDQLRASAEQVYFPGNVYM